MRSSNHIITRAYREGELEDERTGTRAAVISATNK